MRKILTSLVVASTLFTVNSYADLNDGLVAHYEFEDNANDSSGNENHGTEYGDVSYVDGVIGKAIKLNGILSDGGYLNPDRVVVKNSDSLKLERYATFSYWVLIDGDKKQTGANCTGDAIDGKSGIVFAKSGDRNGMYISSSDTSTGINFQPYLGGKGGSASDLITSYKNFRQETYIIDSELNSIKIFINGEIKKENEGLIDFSYSNERDLYIGVSYNRYISGVGGACLDYWYPLDGQIDDIRIYNRALSEDEIKELYSLGTTTEEIEQPFYTQEELDQKIEDNTVATKELCKSNPSECGIVIDECNIGLIDKTFIDGQNSGWINLGDSVAISDFSIFENTQIVWSYNIINGWSAYSPIPTKATAILNSSYTPLSNIPANQGFWIYK
jgi:hypothetical protein